MAVRFLNRLGDRAIGWRSLSWIIEQATPRADPHVVELFAKTGIAFIHIPKTGGTSVSAMLYGCDVKHRSWKDIFDLAPDKFEHWLKIAIVRDPIDRFLSAYDYLSGGGRNRFDAEFGRRFVMPYGDVNTLVTQMRDARFRGQLMRYFHFRPQSDYVVSAAGLCMVNRLIPFERLSADMATLLKKPNNAVPVLNATRGRRTGKACLEIGAISLIHQLYAPDFELHRLSLSREREFFRKQIAND